MAAGRDEVNLPHFRRYGCGPSLVLVHGFLGSADMWWTVEARLGKAFDVIAVDLPGFGGRSMETTPDRMEVLAAAVIDIVDRLGIERFKLCGHSMGGMIAQQIAIDFRARVSELVLYGTAASGKLKHRFEEIQSTMQRMREHGVATIGREIVRSWLTVDSPAYDRCVQAISAVTLPSAVAALFAIDTWDPQGRLRELTMPSLVIGGDRDRSTPPEDTLALYRAIPQAQLCVVPGAAHGVHLEQADPWCTAVERFLTKTSTTI